MVIEKRKKTLINLAYFGVIALLVFAVLRYALPAIAPFSIAAVIAYFLRKPIRFLESKLKLPGKFSAILAVVLFYGAAGGVLAFLGVKAVSAVMSLIGSIPTLYETHALPFFIDIVQNTEAILMRMDPALVSMLDGLGTQMIQSISQMTQNLSVKAMGLVTSLASSVPALFIELVILIISTFFIAIDYNRLTGFCLRQMNENTKSVFLQIKEYVAGTLWVCIRSYALIMSITFVELSIALTIVGLEHAFLVAAVIALFDILPVLGTGGIMIPWSLLTLVQGNYTLGLELLAIYIIITVIRNIIEPKIVGSQLGLHPVVTLCSMFVGVQLFGVVGLFGFPIGLSLLRYLNDHGVIKLFR